MESDAVHEWFKENGYKPTSGNIIEYCELKEPAMGNKPMRDEVEDYIYDSEGETDSEGNDTFYRRLAKAYLSQEEELRGLCLRNGKLSQMYSQQSDDMVDVLEQRDQLEAENQALQVKANHAIQRFVRGEDKACLVCGKREPCQETPNACTFEPTPMELMRENQALKAKIEGTFRFETPKPGELLRYHLNEEDTLP